MRAIGQSIIPAVSDTDVLTLPQQSEPQLQKEAVETVAAPVQKPEPKVNDVLRELPKPTATAVAPPKPAERVALRDPQINGLYRPKNAHPGEGEVVVLGYHGSSQQVFYRTAGVAEEPTWRDLAGFYDVFTPVVRTAITLPVAGQKYAERLKPTNKFVVSKVYGDTVEFFNLFNARIVGKMDIISFEDQFVASR